MLLNALTFLLNQPSIIHEHLIHVLRIKMVFNKAETNIHGYGEVHVMLLFDFFNFDL